MDDPLGLNWIEVKLEGPSDITGRCVKLEGLTIKEWTFNGMTVHFELRPSILNYDRLF